MDSVKCATLIKVLELGNIHAAAEALGYTPSGISKMMLSLEQELGVTLLSRSKKGVKPTRACQEFLPALRRVAAAGDALQEAVGNYLGINQGTLRIGIAYPQYLPPLLEVLKVFRKEHPGVSMSLKEANSTPLAEMVSAGELDLAIISERSGDFQWEELLKDELVAVLPSDHPMVSRSRFNLRRLEKEEFVEIGPGEDADNHRMLARFGITQNTCCSVSDDRMGYKLVEAGLGIALSNRLLLQDISEEVVVLPITPKLPISIGVAFANADIASPAAHVFVDALLQRLKTK